MHAYAYVSTHVRLCTRMYCTCIRTPTYACVYMLPCVQRNPHVYVHAPISDQAPCARMSDVAGVKSPCDAVFKPWVELLNTRRKKGAIELEGAVHLVTNIKQGGLVHRLAEGTRHLPRERRRSRCGWRVGGAAANVRFTKTSFWPPPYKNSLLCSRCFCSGGTSPTKAVTTADEIDYIES